MFRVQHVLACRFRLGVNQFSFFLSKQLRRLRLPGVAPGCLVSRKYSWSCFPAKERWNYVFRSIFDQNYVGREGGSEEAEEGERTRKGGRGQVTMPSRGHH